MNLFGATSCAVFCWFLFWNSPANAGESVEALSGPAVTMDGDTLEIDGQSIRLHGIDAPEMRAGRDGAHARAFLDDLTAGPGRDQRADEIKVERYKPA